MEKKFKKCVFLIYGFILIFVFSNYLMWNFLVKDLLTDINDLSRMGYFKIDNVEHLTTRLSKHYLNFGEGGSDKADIVVVGDSFMQGPYLDELAIESELDVVNFPRDSWERFCDSQLDLLILMLNNGYFDKVKPKIVILGTVQRLSSRRLAKDFDWKRVDSINNMRQYFKDTNTHKVDENKYMSLANLKVLKSYFRFNFDKSKRGHLTDKVSYQYLNQPFFTNRYSDVLFYMSADENNLSEATFVNINKTNDNFNILADKLKEKGIRLFVMVNVDKYTLYRDYFKNTQMPKGSYWQEIRRLPKRYQFIDTYKYLKTDLQNGEKDVYFSGDAHWSYVTQLKIGKLTGKLIRQAL